MVRHSNDDTVGIRCYCHAETSKAMLLSDDGFEGNAQWVPKSQISKADIERGKDGQVVMKEWIAKKCRFI